MSDKDDIIVIDLGLSFNQERHVSTVTQTSEAFANEFLHLPENESRDPDLRRDPRSDVTAVVGVFYYCLTGQVPIQLRDANGQMPHRRPGKTVRDYHGSDSRCALVERVLDRGFTFEIEGRFRSIVELMGRLRCILDPAATRNEDIEGLMQQIGSRFRQLDRPSQPHLYRQHTGVLIQSIVQYLNERWQKHNKSGLYAIQTAAGGIVDRPLPPGVDKVSEAWWIQASIQPHGHSIRVQFMICAEGPECLILKTTLKIPAGRQPGQAPPWEEFFRYRHEHPPSAQELDPMMNSILAAIIRDLANEVRPGEF